MNLKLILIASAVAAVGLAMGQGAKVGTKPGQGGGGKPGMMRQGGPGGPGGNRKMPTADERVKMMTKMLNLTPDQQKKLKPIYEASGKKMKVLMEDKKMNEQQKRDAFKKMRDENRKKVSAILTKAQLAKLESMRRSGPGGPGGPGGRGPGGPGGPGGPRGGGAAAGPGGSPVSKASGLPPGVNPNGSMKKGKGGGTGH